MRLKLFAAFSLIILVTILITILLVGNSTKNQVQAFMYRGAMVEISTFQPALEEYYQKNSSWEGVESLLHPITGGQGKGQGSGAGTRKSNQRVRLADETGAVIYDSSSSDTVGELSRIEKQSAVHLLDGENEVGLLLLEDQSPLQKKNADTLVNNLNRAAILAAVITGFISLLLASIISWQIVKPVSELKQAAEKLGLGNLSTRVTVRGHDEISQLGTSFNQMADSLERSENSRKSMTADIAHELRNPLAVQRAHLEAMYDGLFEPNQENLKPVLEQNELLERLVEDLRTLALADSGKLELHKTEVDFHRLIASLVRRFQPEAARNNVKIILSVQENPQEDYNILVDQHRIEQMVGNLISNAIRFSPTESEISIHLGQDPDNITLKVRDRGEGIPDDVMPYIFNRFYRADQSRSRDGGSTGLGLNIANQIAAAHDGSISAKNHQESGAVFFITIPKSL